MPDHVAIQKALRARLLTLYVCTTGTTSLSATLSGYARSSGSFLVDGFAVGMEVLPTGFTDTDRVVITSLTATAMTVDGGRTVDAEAGGRSLAVGLPEGIAWDNVMLTPTGGRPYLEESYIPATSSLVSAPATGGTAEDTGLYVIRWYGLANTGLGSLAAPASAILELFKPGTALTVADGTVHVRGDIGPFGGAIRGDLPGWSVVTVTIPWRLYSVN